MTPLSIQVPFPVFQDRDGQPLDNGYVWIGQPNLNPQTNPVVAYFDAALTIPAAQPLRTLNGYVSNAGTPAQIYVDGADFSILVQDNKGTMVYNFPSGTGIGADACGLTYNPPFTGAVPTPVCVKLAETVSVKDFGAVGDGTTDNYVALKAAADYMTAAGGGTLYFPPGDYYIDRFVTVSNGVVDPLQFNNCNGLALLGYGAKISNKGDYYRDVASTRGLSGLVVRNCRNVLIAGFELDGNVDQTTTAGGLAEPATYGVYILSCERVSVEDVWSHHFINDGAGIRDDGVQTNPRIASKYVTFNNVKCTYNGRQGLSLVQGRYCTFTNCDFSFNGRTTISFSPSAGVDIEPNRNVSTPAPNQMDVDTGECHFINCLFSENQGSQFVAGEDFNIDGVRLDGCQIITGGGSVGGTDTFILQVVRGSVNNCVFDTGSDTAGRQIYFGIAVSTISTCIVNGCTFYLRSPGNKIVDNQSADTIFINNRIFVFGTTPHTGTQQYIGSNNTNSEWTGNYFWAAKEIYADGGAGDRHIILSYAPRLSRNNRFETDLLASAGDTGTAHFANGYGAATISDGDVYVGTAPGAVDTFRPSFNSVFNTNLPYNKSLPGFASATYDPPSLLTGTSATTTVSVTGASIGDFVTASFQRDLLGITLFAWVSAANTVSVQFRNDTGVTRDLGSAALRVQVTPIPR